MKINFRAILKSINVIQEETGNMGYIRHRLNPYNPLSYIALVVVVIVGLISFGVLGFRKEISRKNPFYWQ